MRRRRSTPPLVLGHRWYLADWAALSGKRQVDAQRDLGWAKATASDLWNGKQRYTQDLVDAVAGWLQIAPYELLMPPAEAMSLRNIRESAMAIAAEDGRKFEPAPPATPPGAPERRRIRGYG